MRVFMVIVLVLILNHFPLLLCASADSSTRFKVTYRTQQDLLFDTAAGCKLFFPCLNIDGFGTVCLDQQVCSGSLSFDSEPHEEISREAELFKYRQEEARYGVDTETIKVSTFADLVYVEWQTLEQGSGLYVDKEYRVFKKGNPNPLIIGGVPIAGRWGVNTALAGDVRVLSFGSDHLLLQVNSSRFEGSGYKQPLFFFDEQYGEYVATIALQKVVKYAISQQGDVSVVDGHIYYQAQEHDSLKEVAEFFGVNENELLAEARLIELPIDPEMAKKIFTPVRNGITRALYHDVMALKN